VSEGTAKRVREAVSSLGYVPNAFAQALIKRSSHVLAVALPDIHGEFYSELLRGADAQAKRDGYHLLVVSGQGQPGSEGLGLEPLLGLVDGLALMVTEANDVLVKRLAGTRLPVVVLDAAPAGTNLDTIVIDNEAGASEATRHLLNLVPPDRCYFVGGPKDNFDTARRAEAFAKTVQVAQGGRVAHANVAFGSYSVEWGRERALQMHEEGVLAGAGLLAGNDEIAYGIIHGAREVGIDVPAQALVVGFDDTRLASLVRPTLSTVRVPLAEVGATAIGLLVRRVKDPGAVPMHVQLRPTLVVRQSTTRA
jgi:LacI family transcriptional regulator